MWRTRSGLSALQRLKSGASSPSSPPSPSLASPSISFRGSDAKGKAKGIMVSTGMAFLLGVSVYLEDAGVTVARTNQ